MTVRPLRVALAALAALAGCRDQVRRDPPPAPVVGGRKLALPQGLTPQTRRRLGRARPFLSLRRPDPRALGAGAADVKADAGRAPTATPWDGGSLTVPGYATPVVLTPRAPGPGPWPVLVVLHGNFDRPEWECDTWSAARAVGFVVCPRGRRRTDVPRHVDRWTYRGVKAAAMELRAVLDALSRRYPGKVRKGGVTVAGFSLGAIYAARIVRRLQLHGAGLILVEGGSRVRADEVKKLRALGFRKVAYLCGSRTRCTARARGAMKRWRSGGLRTRLWIMRGVGHGYSQEFSPMAREVLRWVGPDRTVPRTHKGG